MKRIGIMMIVVILIFVGCNDKNISTEKKIEKKEIPKLDGKVLNIAVAEDIESIDPQKVSSIPSFTVLYNVLEGLVREENGEIKPGIAKYWGVSGDGKTYRFYLRDAYWEDGLEITAKQFEHSFRRLVDPRIASDYAFIAFPIKNAQKVYEGELPPEDLKVHAIDDKILEIELENPTEYFLMSLGTMPHFTPMRIDYLEDYKGEYASNCNYLSYNGPFVIEAWEKGEFILLKKNEHYWNKDKINMDYIYMNIELKSAERLYMFENNEIDFVDVPPLMVDSYINQVDLYYSGGNDFLLFNQKNYFLKNKNLREAIARSIDRNEFIDITTQGRYEAATRFVLPVVKGIKETYGEDYPFSFFSKSAEIERANKMLNAAILEFDNIDKQEIKLSLLVSKGEKEAAMIIKEMIEKNLKITIEIDVVEYKERLMRESREEFDIVYTGWTPDYNDPMSYLEIFVSDSTYNHSGYKSRKYDDLVKKAREESIVNKRFNMLFEAEKRILNDYAIAPIQFRRNAWMRKAKLINVYKNFYGPRENFIYADFVD